MYRRKERKRREKGRRQRREWAIVGCFGGDIERVYVRREFVITEFLTG